MKNALNEAIKLDQENPLKKFRDEFTIPNLENNGIYFTGHSLGPMPKKAKEFIDEEISQWSSLGVSAFFKKNLPWCRYSDQFQGPLSRLVGAKENEVSSMNGLTLNLHLLMVSFYRPNKKRYKILIEKNAFPSDQYAVDSQVRFHGFEPKEAIIEVEPAPGHLIISLDLILETIEKNKDSLSLVLLGNVNYLSGQYFDISKITELAQRYDIKVGFDLAHGVGNLCLKLHEWKVDFAVWCSYKYLNSGPGAAGGFFIHEKHHGKNIPRFEGWFGHNKERRFLMEPTFDPIPSAQAWEISNPPVLQMAAMRASLEIFERAKIEVIRQVGDQLTNYLQKMINENLPNVEIITPEQRGSMLSIRVGGLEEELMTYLSSKNILLDFRKPHILRITPAPLYNTFQEIYRLISHMKDFFSLKVEGKSHLLL